MSSKQSLTEEELNQLIEMLSQRKSDHEGRTTLLEVRESLTQLGLAEFWQENDIEKVQKQVNRAMKRRIFKNYFVFGLILTMIVAPLSAYGGFKIHNFLIAKFPDRFGFSNINSIELEDRITLLTADKKNLEEQVKDITEEKKQIELRVLELEKETLSTPGSPSPSSSTPGSSTPNPVNYPQSFEVQGLTFELQRCQKSNTTPTSQSINCIFLITSQKDRAKVFLYAGNNNKRSRMIEQGQEYLSSRVEIGSAYDNYSVSNDLIKDAPTEAVITFENISSEIEKIGVLSVISYLQSADYNDEIRLEFRNITLSKQ